MVVIILQVYIYRDLFSLRCIYLDYLILRLFLFRSNVVLW